MLTRNGVAKRLGKSIATVRRMENAELHPTRDARGVHRFSVDEVERVARADPGSEERRHRMGLAAPQSRDYEAEIAEHQRRFQELSQRTAQLEQARASDHHSFQVALQIAERRVKDFKEPELPARAHAAVAEAAEHQLMRAELAELLGSLTRRQLARIDPVEFEELLRFIGDDD
jgi:hypothetical protein